MASDLLALLDTLDGLHKATTSGEWRSTWDDPVVNGDDDSQATIETMDPHATGLDKGIVQVLWFNGHHAGCTRENAASIAALHNAYPHLAQALRTALTPTTDGEREAVAALAKTEEPPRHVHSWRLVCDRGHEVAGSSAETEPPHWATWSTRCEECDYNFADENAYDFTVTHHEWDVTPDQKVDAAHLRTALALLATERAKAADAARERDELRAALLNESGQGDPPSEGWAFADPDPLGAKPCDYGMEFRVWMKGDVLLRRTDHTPAWRTYRLNEGWCAVAFGPAYDTAREAMKAADAHTKVTP